MAALAIAVASRVFADVVSYECNSRPTQDGWTLLQAWCDPQEWADDGRLFQRVEFCPEYDPPEGQQFDYTRSLAAFSGSPAFFVEWRVQTDGDRSELPFTAPAALVVGNNSVSYHFTIADDEIRVIRDNSLPILYVDIEPGVAHTYRVELYARAWYVWYIDGWAVDSGVPETHYPALAPDSVINTRAKAQFVESTTVWDYIRWGGVPADGSGDYDSNQRVDARDFYFFHECLTNSRLGINGGPDEDAGPGCRFADFDGDGDVDLRDLAAFQNAFTGGE